MSAIAEKAPEVRETVLVVDDDPTARLMASATLANAGFAVREAEDGTAALASLEQHRPDLVMLDVTMPGMDGFTTCARMRELAGCESVPILMVTGLDDVDSIEKAYAAGATDFATKPINWPLLGHRVRYLLRAAETRDRLEDAVATIVRGRALLDEAERLAVMGSWEWEAGRTRLRCSPGLEQLLALGCPAEERDLATLLEQVSHDDRPRIQKLIEQVSGHGESVDTVHWIARSDGEKRCVQHRIEAIPAQGGIFDLRGTMQDVTERRVAEERVRRLAYFDSLTGLPNREAFRDHLMREVSRAGRVGAELAVLFLDLDEFKRINDTLGHAAGDELLQQVAARLQDSVRSSDMITRDSASHGVTGPVSADGEASVGEDNAVARLGGDEFTILLNDLSTPEDAARVAERILDLLSSPMMVAGHQVVVSPSIGIAVYPGDSQEPQTLLECADTAMYFAKRSGKNLYRYYDSSMSEAARRRLAIEHRLRVAIADDELELHYQPQLELRSGRIESVEALLRWNCPELGSVSPAEFIPLAEETRLIIPMGQWVLEQACRQLRSWLDAGLGVQRVAVNISPVQFVQPEFVGMVERALEDSGLPEGSLELEITETLLARDVDLAVETLTQLKALGVKLSIDDFGTGYSSLSQLKRFPVDRLKIDRSFVHDIVTDADDAAIAMAVIGMAGSMELGVVAEGVETRGQLEFLKERSCDEIQGFLLSRALPSDELERLLRASPGKALVNGEGSPVEPTLKVVRSGR